MRLRCCFGCYKWALWMVGVVAYRNVSVLVYMLLYGDVIDDVVIYDW